MKKEKKIEAETAAELKESIERLAKEENMTPVELMSETLVEVMIEEDELIITQEITGGNGKKSILIGTEKRMRSTMKLVNDLTENEINEVIETLKEGSVYKVNRNFETEYRIATKEDLIINKKNADKEAEEPIKELEID